MAHSFNALGYARGLCNAGISSGRLGPTQRQPGTAALVTKTDMAAALDRLSLRLTLRLGGMPVIAVAALATISKL